MQAANQGKKVSATDVKKKSGWHGRVMLAQSVIASRRRREAQAFAQTSVSRILRPSVSAPMSGFLAAFGLTASSGGSSADASDARAVAPQAGSKKRRLATYAVTASNSQSPGQRSRPEDSRPQSAPAVIAIRPFGGDIVQLQLQHDAYPGVLSNFIFAMDEFLESNARVDGDPKRLSDLAKEPLSIRCQIVKEDAPGSKAV